MPFVLIAKVRPRCMRVLDAQRLSQLEGEEVPLRAQDRGNNPDLLRQLDDACSAPMVLKLKVGAQVCHHRRSASALQVSPVAARNVAPDRVYKAAHASPAWIVLLWARPKRHNTEQRCRWEQKSVV